MLSKLFPWQAGPPQYSIKPSNNKFLVTTLVALISLLHSFSVQYTILQFSILHFSILLVQITSTIAFIVEIKNCCSTNGVEPVPIEFRVSRVIIEQRRAAYWFLFVAPYLCRPHSAFHSAFTTLWLKHIYGRYIMARYSFI